MHNEASYDERKLLLLVAAGDRRAFTGLYSLYLDNLYTYVFLFTQSRETTEEIVQDVFIRIWEGRDLLREVQSFQSYLFRAAKNRVLDYIRHQQVRRKALAIFLEQRSTGPETPGDAFDYKAYYLLVQEAIEKLSPRRRLVFRLTTEKGLSYDEIAAQLNISKSAVKKQLYEAYDFVHQYLAKKDELSFLLILLACIPAH